MIFRKICRLLILYLGLSCSTSKSKDSIDTNNQIKMDEIIVYVDAKVNMKYDGKFISENKKEALQINELFVNTKVTVQALTEIQTELKTDAIFRVLVPNNETEQLLEQLQKLTFVTGAYHKPKAEDPDTMDFD